jgi:hypothetical protein
MPRRNLLYNAALHDFVSDFASGPVADGPFFGVLTGHRHHLADLLGRDLGSSSWTRDILEALIDGQILQRDRLQAKPAPAPRSHGIHTHVQFSGNLAVVLPLGRR